MVVALEQGKPEGEAGRPKEITAMDSTAPSATPATPEPQPPNLPEELDWVFNPWRANWRRPTLALLLELVTAVGAGWSTSWPNVWPQIITWGGVSFLLLLGMTMAIFFPARYKLDAQGVMVHFLGAPSFRKWTHYRNYYVHDTGVHLTTMPKPSRLDPFRGHYLQYGVPGSQGERALVVPYIKEHLRPYLGKPPAP